MKASRLNRGATIAAAFALDLVAGDPAWLPHPVRAFGAAIALGERRALRRSESENTVAADLYDGEDDRLELLAGTGLSLAIVGIAALCASVGIESTRRCTNGSFAASFEIVLAASTLAVRDLLVEADAVIAALEVGDLPRARVRLARIVGRDTEALDASGIARAVIETLAESTCDGIVAPLCALALGGVPLAFAFKAASTLDSMIGHIEAPYTHFGRFAARLDDVLCFVPARLAALAICVLAPLAGGSFASARATLAIDGAKHRSPNAGRPEAAMAGALCVRLGGANTYAGVEHRGETIGALFPQPSAADARRARTLVLWVSTVFALTTALATAVCDVE